MLAIAVVSTSNSETAESAATGSDNLIQAGSRAAVTNESSSPAWSVETSNSETAESAATGSDESSTQAGSRDDVTNEPSSPGSVETSNSGTAESAATGSDESSTQALETPKRNFGSSDRPPAPKRPRLVLSDYEEATKAYEKAFGILILHDNEWEVACAEDERQMNERRVAREMRGQRNKEVMTIVKGNHAHIQLMMHAHNKEIEAKDKEHAKVIKLMDDKYKDECSKAKDTHDKEIEAKDKEIAELRNEFAEYKDAHDKEIEEFTKYEDWAEEQLRLA